MEYNKFDENLIALVRKHSNIYDSKSAAFKDFNTRKITWHIIGRQLNASSETCKHRWNNLRTRYAFEKRKSRNDNRPSNWQLFNSMTFLDQFMKRRTSYRMHNFNPVPPQMFEMNGHFLDATKVKSENFQEDKIDGHLHDNKNDEMMYAQPRITMEEGKFENYPLPSPVDLYPSTYSKVPRDDFESCDVEFSFGRTVALMLKNIRGRQRRWKAQADVLNVLSSYDSESDEDACDTPISRPEIEMEEYGNDDQVDIHDSVVAE